jgi:hypothetical protein
MWKHLLLVATFENAYKKEYTMWLEQKPNLQIVGKISLTKHGGVYNNHLHGKCFSAYQIWHEMFGHSGSKSYAK